MSNVLQASNLSSLEALHAELDALTHPFAKLFPLISEQELAELATDIEANGLREPIAKTVDGRIADGRNRWLACKLTDQEPTYVTLKDGTELLSFIVSKNLRRRHLSTSQRAAIAAEIANLPPGGSANLPSQFHNPKPLNS